MNYKKILSILIIFIFFSTSIQGRILKNSLQSDNKIIPNQTENSNCLKNKNYYALLVGINDYPGVELDLLYSINEITSFKNTLLKSRNWEESNIKVLTNADATSDNIKENINWLDKQENENDTSIFYYAGHGGNTPTNEYLITYGSSLSDVEFAEEIDKLEGKVVIILDCCYSGGFIEELEDRNRVILAACAKEGLAFQDSRLKSGFFGYFLNLSLEKITTTAEFSFLFAKFLTIMYTKWLSNEIDKKLIIEPQISDKAITLVKMIYRQFFSRNIFDLIKVDNLYDYNDEESIKIWIM